MIRVSAAAPAQEAQKPTSFQAAKAKADDYTAAPNNIAAIRTSAGKQNIRFTSNSGLRNLKMVSAPVQQDNEEVQGEGKTEKTASISVQNRVMGRVNKGAVALTIAWFVLAGAALVYNFTGAITVQAVSMNLSYLIAPPALLWLLLSSLQRPRDLERHTAFLKEELRPSDSVRDNSEQDILTKRAEKSVMELRILLGSLHQTRQALEQDMQSLRETGNQTTAHMEQISGKVQQRARAALDLVEVLEKRSRALDEATTAHMTRWDEAQLQMNDHATRIEEMVSACLNPQDILDRLEQSSTTFDQKLGTVQGLMQNLQASSEVLETHAETIEQAAHSAHDKLHEAGRKINEQGMSLHLLNDQLALNTQHITENLTAACTRFEQTAATTGHAADIAVGKITDACSQTELQTERLSQAADQTAIKTEAMVSYLKGQTDDLLTNTSESLDVLKTTGHSLSVQARELTDKLDYIRDNAAIYIETMEQASESLNIRFHELKTLSDEAAYTFDRSEHKLVNGTERFITTSQKAITAAEAASRDYDVYTDKMIGAIRNMERQNTEMKTRAAQEQDDNFMSGARFILESLYSLSVDLTRGLDGEISEKMWRAFNKGDYAVFVRRFQDLGDEVPLDKISMKYRHDYEFRTYVRRYLHQFEEMFSRARSQNKMLVTSLASGDTGKLYALLCRATGHENILSAPNEKNPA